MEHGEEESLRIVGRKNARSVLLLRQHAEEELLRAREALELRTAELAHSLALARATLESTTDGILAVEESGKVTAFNENFVKMWRISRELIELREQQPLLDAMGREFEDPLRFLTRIKEICASALPESFDPLELLDGRAFERFSRVQYVDGHDVGRVWSFRDVTERNRMEEKERQFSSIVESSNDAIISKSLHGMILSWNKAAERLFGYTAEQAVGRHISLLIPADRADEEDHIIARLRAGQRVEHFDTVRRRSDGQLVEVSLTISPVRNPKGRIVAASKIVRDITDRKRMEHELRRYAATLSEADCRKNDFIAMLAHELRNPLAAMRNALQVVRLRAERQTLASASELMERQIRHMVRLVDDLFDVSRISRGKVQLCKEAVELAPIVRDAVEAVRPLMERMGHDLTVTLTPKPLYLNADPTRLAQVLGNLLTNACKFTDNGGRIRLRVDQDGDQVVIRVLDNGIGIPPDQLPRVFDAFTQLDTRFQRSAGGLGIGLTLARNLVEMHDGTLEAHSAGGGQGSEFVVRLPIVTTVPGLRPSAPASAPLSAGAQDP